MAAGAGRRAGSAALLPDRRQPGPQLLPGPAERFDASTGIAHGMPDGLAVVHQVGRPVDEPRLSSLSDDKLHRKPFSYWRLFPLTLLHQFLILLLLKFHVDQRRFCSGEQRRVRHRRVPERHHLPLPDLLLLLRRRLQQRHGPQRGHSDATTAVRAVGRGRAARLGASPLPPLRQRMRDASEWVEWTAIELRERL